MSSHTYTGHTSEGRIKLKVHTDIYETYYKVFGDLNNSRHRPLVALHGGPGMNHLYMLPDQWFWHNAGIPVVMYDQIGGGQSTHRPDAPKEFWSPELFMAELDNLLNFLGIQNDFDLLGQSWGGMLAAQYAATYSPPGLKRLIISNSPASIELNTQGTDQLLARFPEEWVRRIRELEALGQTKSEEYQEMSMKFYKQFVCTVDPWPKELADSFGQMVEDPTVYESMLGPSEFTTIGTLKDWDIIPIIHKIAVPTLLISAPNDSIQQCAAIPFFHQIPKVKWVELQNSTHLAQFEEPEKYFAVIHEFLKGTEGM